MGKKVGKKTWEHSPGREEVRGLDGALGTGDLTSSIRVLQITPLILTCKLVLFR